MPIKNRNELVASMDGENYLEVFDSHWVPGADRYSENVIDSTRTIESSTTPSVINSEFSKAINTAANFADFCNQSTDLMLAATSKAVELRKKEKSNDLKTLGKDRKEYDDINTAGAVALTGA